jgi:hypothetical protein
MGGLRGAYCLRIAEQCLRAGTRLDTRTAYCNSISLAAGGIVRIALLSP